jgi:hypothetical protein
MKLEEVNSWIQKVTPTQLGKAYELALEADSYQFLSYFYEELFVINFDWGSWDEGRQFLKSENPDYGSTDEVFCYKLITAIIRNDRFFEGALQANLENGTIHRIIERLIELKKN